MESKETADAYETSGTYREMVNKVEHMFAAAPILRSYEAKKWFERARKKKQN